VLAGACSTARRRHGLSGESQFCAACVSAWMIVSVPRRSSRSRASDVRWIASLSFSMVALISSRVGVSPARLSYRKRFRTQRAPANFGACCPSKDFKAVVVCDTEVFGLDANCTPEIGQIENADQTTLSFGRFLSGAWVDDQHTRPWWSEFPVGLTALAQGLVVKTGC